MVDTENVLPKRGRVKTGSSVPRSKQQKSVRGFRVGDGLPSLAVLAEELQDMTDCLLGRIEPPVNSGLMTLMEVADAFFARGSEITMMLQKMEREGRYLKSSPHYKFRTGELRTFCEMAKRSSDLGSRRITAEGLKVEQERTGRQRGFGDDD